MPEYKRAAYAGESLTLESGGMTVRIYKRISGWGFAEIYTKSGRLMAVLDHFGELPVDGRYAVADGVERAQVVGEKLALDEVEGQHAAATHYLDFLTFQVV